MALRVQPWFTSSEMLFYFLTFPAMLLLEYEITGKTYKWVSYIAAFTAFAGTLVTVAGVIAAGMEKAAFSYMVSGMATYSEVVYSPLPGGNCFFVCKKSAGRTAFGGNRNLCIFFGCRQTVAFV